ncbi:hypothetical protein [Agromyces protaetiae]|uniref:hypothetical protein n=1 Tax=Agromyces protaetiae TaxID=2509455 RepID=UPI0013EAABEA|nr:hypothetical protein [Agromyces protaetiae]
MIARTSAAKFDSDDFGSEIGPVAATSVAITGSRAASARVPSAKGSDASGSLTRSF